MTKKKLEQYVIDDVLAHYSENFRMLKSGEYEGTDHARGYFEVSPAWFYDCGPNDYPVDHFTAAEGVFSHNQLAIAQATELFLSGGYENIKPMDYETVYEKQINNMLITNVDISFTKPFISTDEYRMDLHLTSQVLKQTRSGLYLFLNYEFTFEDGKSYGKSSAAVKIDEESIVDLEAVSVAGKKK